MLHSGQLITENKNIVAWFLNYVGSDHFGVARIHVLDRNNFVETLLFELDGGDRLGAWAAAGTHG